MPAVAAPSAPTAGAPAGDGATGGGSSGLGRWRLRRRLGVTYVIAAVVLLVVVGVVASSLVRLTDAIHTRSDVMAPALLASNRLVASVVDQETGLRGYLLQGTEDYLSPYNAGRTEERRDLAELRGVLAGRPDLLAGVTALDARIRAWHTAYADPAIAAVRA